MASSSNDPDSLVTLHFHDFRVERMRHWWTLLGEDDHADIVGFFGKFPPFMRLQVDRGLLEALASLLGTRPIVAFPLGKWILSLLWRMPFPAKLARDFIAGKKGWKKFRINAFKIAFAGDRERGFRCSAHSFLQLWFCSHLRHFYRLQTPYHFERHTVSQTVNIALPFTGNSRDWASYLLDLPLGEWSWKVTWGPAVWKPWTHCALFDGVPLPGVWGCTGYYPSLALRQFGGVQYPPRLGDLDAVTFDYIPSEDMWRLLSRVEVIWEGRLSEVVLIEDGSPGDSSVASDFRRVERGVDSLFYSQAYCTARHITFFGVSLSSGVSLHWAAEREASAARVESLRSTLHHNSVAVANVRRDLEQLEISEDAKEQLEENLAEAREQLETEQAERTRVQDELDSLRSYTQALVDPATGRPQDIVGPPTGARCESLQSELDLVHDALESNASWLNQEGFPVVTSLHQINQVMDSLGARARAVWEEHDEGDPALSTALGRFCRETCIRLGH
uniref:Aminotransferase-like plant mobile domain-containing protein n=1 Tax=Fagus sylvatica TaxID=28930 RepID=A0A2N9H318_FAGSY